MWRKEWKKMIYENKEVEEAERRKEKKLVIAVVIWLTEKEEKMKGKRKELVRWGGFPNLEKNIKLTQKGESVTATLKIYRVKRGKKDGKVW